uniref:Uncharacterized protein n=1 Tax=Micrurus lemniscatus lemniscatus TaxID=129467 RepID=A0A2D4I4C4_MICLE
MEPLLLPKQKTAETTEKLSILNKDGPNLKIPSIVVILQVLAPEASANVVSMAWNEKPIVCAPGKKKVVYAVFILGQQKVIIRISHWQKINKARGAHFYSLCSRQIHRNDERRRRENIASLLSGAG